MISLIGLTKVFASLTLDLTELGSIMELALKPLFSHNINRKIKTLTLDLQNLRVKLGCAGSENRLFCNRVGSSTF